MKIVVLDGYTLNPGDLDWSSLEKLGELTVYDRTLENQVAERSEEADILFTNKTVLTSETINRLDTVKYIGVLATGYNVVDLEACRSKGIEVTNVPGYGPDSVAQMVFAHILNITNSVSLHAEDVGLGGWGRQEDFCYLLAPQLELKDKFLGVVGFGEIGQATARIGQAFGMKVLIHTRTEPPALPDNMELVDLETLMQQSDVISLHCPLTDNTAGMINNSSLASMKDSAILINCSRGPLVEENDLADALNNDVILAAGLDVLTVEPANINNPLIGAKNCFITPHIAWATFEARERLLSIAVSNLENFLQGKKTNSVL